MAYLAIARKWRPQRFEDIVGQHHVTRTLQNAIQLGRVHHAFLFTGARGVGKTTAARILAKALNCETGPTPTPCNECRSCKEITSGIANDVQEIDAASNTGVDNVRDLRDKLRYLPSSGKYKIYIIDEVHMLSVAAFNALLKTLEEPPPHVVFIFATTDPQKVPDTILSRCQRFDFKRIPIKQIVEKLGEIASTEGVQVSEASLLMISREAEGSMRDAQSLLDQVLASAGTAISDEDVVEILGIIDRRLIFQAIRGILEREPDQALEVIDRIYSFGFDIKQFARELLEVVRHLNVVRISSQAERFIDVAAEEYAQLRELASRFSVDELSRHFHILTQGFDELARSESPRFVLEMTVLRMAQVRPVQPLDELLGRLAAMEAVVRGGGARPVGAPGAGTAPRGGLSDAAPSGGVPPARSAGPGETPGSGLAGRFGGDAGTPSGRSGSDAASPASRFGGDAASTAGRAAPTDAGAGAGGSTPRFSPPGAPRGNPFSRESGTAPARPGSIARPQAPGGDQGRASAGPPGFAPSTDTEDGDDDDNGPAVAVVSTSGANGSMAGVASTSGANGSAATAAPAGASPWLEFMDFMLPQGDNRAKFVFLRDACPIREEPGRIVLGLRTGLSASRAEREVADPELQRLLREFFNRPVVIECTQLSEEAVAGQSYLAREAEKERRRVAEIERAELASPRVKAAASVFEVDARDMKVEIEKTRSGSSMPDA